MKVCSYFAYKVSLISYQLNNMFYINSHDIYLFKFALIMFVRLLLFICIYFYISLSYFLLFSRMLKSFFIYFTCWLVLFNSDSSLAHARHRVTVCVYQNIPPDITFFMTLTQFFFYLIENLILISTLHVYGVWYCCWVEICLAGPLALAGLVRFALQYLFLSS